MLLDVAGIAETVGLANWHDPRLWNMAKLPFRRRTHSALRRSRGPCRRRAPGQESERSWSSISTTRSGAEIIGDDGLEGIKIAQGDAIGEAHLAVQRMALDLRQRGIVLAVSSKNYDEVARAPFETASRDVTEA